MNLPTRDDCLAITEKTDAFFRAERVIENQRVELYDYRLASLSDFQDNNAYELRGICFILDEETGIWERNILLNKFFNVNQVSMDDELELTIDGETILVNETHKFLLINGKTKFARDLLGSDDIESW